jgi:hypothetical protein
MGTSGTGKHYVLEAYLIARQLVEQNKSTAGRWNFGLNPIAKDRRIV